ncbi:carbohydrate ABC transporter permease [Kineosporia succinea]|uniref:Multiple sugar transport system permease protein n=1 Tax=Kineosporia succinea TaxID=84632 RepID=A0ABT9P1J5_9ACTN|nr:sugar ABC transporter permease [Kineosporia succinea]MDP9826554.1 multiple sugar transport system permease protein [Kineosporia succinea]
MSATTAKREPTVRRATTSKINRRHQIGWLFVLPFLIVFLAFLVAPLLYAGYLSLFTKGLATGTTFAGFDNYTRAFSDPSFRKGLWLVLRFSLVVIPLQLGVALVAALLLDEITGRLASFSRLMIFLPYAVPAVIGALMWGFLYSPSFGPVEQIASLFNVQAPFLLSSGNIFYGLLNIVTWQWSGYYMIIIFAALKSIDSSIYEAARIDGANAFQIALRIKTPLIYSALVLILIFSLIGTLQFFVEPQIVAPIANGSVTPDFTPNIYAFNLAFRYAQFNYASAISFSLGFVVFLAVAVFTFATRKRGGLFS